MRLLLIDNYDSYTYNLYQLLAQTCGSDVTVMANDDQRLSDLDPADYDAAVISPGPGRPQHAADLGRCGELLDRHRTLPVLGVCLGHQAVAHLAGAQVREGAPRHGHLSQVRHDGSALFDGIPQGFTVTRYHSLHVAEPLPADLSATAWAEDGVVMALRHRRLPRWGVQFHPESVATEHGATLLANFARLAAGSRRVVAGRDPAAHPEPRPRPELQPRPRLRLSVAVLDRAVDTSAAFSELYADRGYAYWLDSSQHGEGRARFSFLGDDSGPLAEVLTYRVGAGAVQARQGGRVSNEPGDIFAVLRRRLAGRAVAADDLPFDLTGGYVGYLGYETKADCGAAAAHTSPTPDAVWIFADRLVAVDHQERKTYLVAVHLPTAAQSAVARAWLDATSARLRRLPSQSDPIHPASRPRAAAEFPGWGASVSAAASAVGQLFAGARLGRDRDQYLADIKTCLEELRRGESYEICLTNRVRLPPVDDPVGFYNVLRRIDPAPYAALLRLGEVTVMGASPERFLRISRDRVVESKPIKGTTPRDADPEVDEELRRSLTTSPKTRAENLMIVDLLRNDLGRVCEVGSVEVPSHMATESYATVHQLVSTVRGRLAPTMSPVDCVRTCFPGGSMTGAPKLRTMEIIDRLEAAPRGVYSGTLGYFGLSGGADLSIVIRTAVATPDGVRIGAGGAIVVGSDPEQEFAETMVKAQALLTAYQTVTGAT